MIACVSCKFCGEKIACSLGRRIICKPVLGSKLFSSITCRGKCKTAFGTAEFKAYRCDPYHPNRVLCGSLRRFPQQRQEQFGEKIWPEYISGEDAFVSLPCCTGPLEKRSGVVPQDVQAILPGQELGHRSLDRWEVGKIELQECDPSPRRRVRLMFRFDRSDGLGCFFSRPAGDVDCTVCLVQNVREFETDSRVSTCDYKDLPWEDIIILSNNTDTSFFREEDAR